MSMISLQMTDTLSCLPWDDPDEHGCIQITIENWHGNDDFMAGRQAKPHLSTEVLSLHGSRAQVRAFAMLLLEKTSGDQVAALVKASSVFLARIKDITTDEFAHGAEREERNALEDALEPFIAPIDLRDVAEDAMAANAEVNVPAYIPAPSEEIEF